MAEFKDAEGRKWVIQIDANALRRVKNECNITLTDRDAFESGDPLVFFDCLLSVIRPQLEQRKLTAEDFGAAYHGDVTEDAADALQEAIANFSHSRPRGLMLTALAKQKEVRTKLMDLAEKKLDQKIQQAEKEAMDQMEKEMGNGSTSGEPSPNALESSV